MRTAVRGIDYLLRLHGRLFEFSQDPECLLRLQLSTAPHTVTINDRIISRGEPVLGLHIWNEHMPKLPPTGADLEWALRLRRRLIHSFQGIARLMQEDERLAQVSSLYGASALFSQSDHTGGIRMMQHLGFTVVPYHRPLGRFGDFWENLFSWWLMWTFNAASLHSRKFWRLQRTEIWMTKEDFLHRFG